MDALVTSFIANLLGEWGDRSQLLVATLATRSPKPWILFLGFLLAALVGSALAALGGVLVGEAISGRATGLLLALALLFAGLTALVSRRTPSTGSGRTPLLLATFLLCLAAEMGDRTQTLTFALAARYEMAVLPTLGATAGMAAAAIPAVLLGRRFAGLPVRPVRLAAAFLFLLAGTTVAIRSLGLV